MDAVALLGGNPYLVQQMIDKLVDTNYRYVELTQTTHSICFVL